MPAVGTAITAVAVVLSAAVAMVVAEALLISGLAVAGWAVAVTAMVSWDAGPEALHSAGTRVSRLTSKSTVAELSQRSSTHQAQLKVSSLWDVILLTNSGRTVFVLNWFRPA